MNPTRRNFIESLVHFCAAVPFIGGLFGGKSAEAKPLYMIGDKSIHSFADKVTG